MNRKHVQSVVQVLSKHSGSHRLFQVAVGRGQHAHVHRNRMTVADSLNLMILKDTEQRNLCFRRQIANLVEEDRAAIGGFEPAEAPLQRARERALLVAEELGGDERRGIAAQFTRMKARPARCDFLWMARAISSLPLPVSPLMSTVESV